MSSGSRPSGTTVVTQNKDPWSGAQPYLTQGFQEAQNLYNRGPNQYYPGQTSIPFSNQTEASLAGIENTALNPGGGLMPTTIDSARNIIGGGMLNSNPWLDRTFDQAAGRVRSQVGAHFGGFAPNSNERYVLGEQLNNLATNIYGGNYANERGLQQSMMAMAPQLESMRYQPASALGQVGAAREQQAGTELNADINRWNFQQQAPQEALARYLAYINGGQQGGSTTETQPYFNNPAALYGGLGVGLLSALGNAGGINGIRGLWS